MLTAHLYLVPRLRMSGAIPLLPLYPLMAWICLKMSFDWKKKHDFDKERDYQLT
jgi:hypothetical protein